jgi:hypothetical protein
VSDIFLSYSSADRDRVAPIAAAFERLGWSVWWDRRILAGQSWDDVIAKALEAARCIVVIWTHASVSSQWVRIEANIGRERGILAPVLIDDAPIPLTFRHIQSASLVGWGGTADSVQFGLLANGIKGVLSHAGQPFPQASAPEPLIEGRALDAAMAGELPIHEPTSLIAMVRCPDSAGLKAILDADDEYSLSSEDVVSKPFELTFPVDANGRIAYAEVLLRVQCPDFDSPAQEKKIRVSRNRDSTVCSFLLTPIASGKLTVQLEIYQHETCVASRLLRSNCVPSGRAGPVGAHRVVTMPLHINVTADDFTRMFERPSRTPSRSAYCANGHPMHPSWPECLECKGERGKVQDFGSEPPRMATVKELEAPSSPRATVIENFVDPQPIAIPIPPPPPTPPAAPTPPRGAGGRPGSTQIATPAGAKPMASYGASTPAVSRRVTQYAGSSGVPVHRPPAEIPASPRAVSPAAATPEIRSSRRIVGLLLTYTWRPEGQIFPVREGRNLIGRNPDCDIAIPEDPHLSDTNSHITYRKSFMLGDMVSMSGTDLNGVPVEDNFVKLPNYAQIRAGSTHFTFIIAEPPATGKSPGQH